MLLLDNSANVNTQGRFYSNALQAALYRRYIAIVKLLINKGADINAQGREFSTAL
jgi:ankyrin repeat protein